MISTVGFICGHIGEVAYNHREMGEGEKFWERISTRVIISECGTTMAASSIRNHMERSIVVIPPQTQGFDVGGEGPTTYVVSLPIILKSVECPLIVCIKKSHSAGKMLEHFMHRNFDLKDTVLQEESKMLPRCNMCGIHVPAGHLINNRMMVH